MFGKFARQRTEKGREATIDADAADVMADVFPDTEDQEAHDGNQENQDEVTDKDERIQEIRRLQAEEYELEEHHSNLEVLRDCGNETQSIEEQDHPFTVWRIIALNLQVQL